MQIWFTFRLLDLADIRYFLRLCFHFTWALSETVSVPNDNFTLWREVSGLQILESMFSMSIYLLIVLVTLSSKIEP